MARRDSTNSRKPRQLGLAPSRKADVSVNNPPGFNYNPSKQKATGSKNKRQSANKKQQREEQQEWAKPVLITIQVSKKQRVAKTSANLQTKNSNVKNNKNGLNRNLIRVNKKQLAHQRNAN